MKLNKTLNSGELIVGDIFKFDFKKLEGTTFDASNLSRDIKENNIDEMFVHFVFGIDTLNIVGINNYYVKDNKILEKFYDESPTFINYLLSKDNENALEKIGNITEKDLTVAQMNQKRSLPLNISNESAADIGLGVKDSNCEELKYGDIIKLDYQKIKETSFYTSEFQDLLNEKKVEDLYIHILNIKELEPNFPTSLEYHLYAVSSRGFENENSDEENEENRELYEKTKNPSFRFDPIMVRNFKNPGVIRKLYKAGLISEKIGNSKSYRLDITDVKKENKRPRLSF